MRLWAVLMVVGLLGAGSVTAQPTPLPELTVEVGNATGHGEALVPVYVHKDQVDPRWQLVAALVDLEWTPGLVVEEVLLGPAFLPFGSYAHVTANLDWRGSCPGGTGLPGTGLRAIALGYALHAEMVEGQPALLLRVSGPPGTYSVHRTCWSRGDNPGEPPFYTYAADLVLQLRGDPHTGWDVLDEWPSTGSVSWLPGEVVLLEEKPLAVEAVSWGTVKALFR